MKQLWLSSLVAFAAALLGAVSLIPLSADAKSSSETVSLRVELDRPVLLAGRTERAVIKVAVDGVRGQRREARSPVNLTLKRAARFTPTEREVIAAANQRMWADYAVNVTAMAKDQAVALVDANRRDEAARQWRERNAELGRIATTYSNAAVSEVWTLNRKEADRLEREGLDNAQRKTYRAENAQTQTQQSGWLSSSSASRP